MVNPTHHLEKASNVYLLVAQKFAKEPFKDIHNRSRMSLRIVNMFNSNILEQIRHTESNEGRLRTPHYVGKK